MGGDEGGPCKDGLFFFIYYNANIGPCFYIYAYTIFCSYKILANVATRLAKNKNEKKKDHFLYFIPTHIFVNEPKKSDCNVAKK
jgi:hypothetical protein